MAASTLDQEVEDISTRFSHSWMRSLEDNEEILRSWKKGEKLGRGAYGEVFKAMVGGKFMAVKRIKVRYGASCGSQSAIERESASLRKEIDVLRKFEHARIVSYEGCLVDGDEVLIFMEYMSGGSIRIMLKKFGAFGSELVRKLTRQILEGLRFLHQRKIIHRDIKGANVLVDSHGDAKLADFGASQQLDALLTTVSGGFRSIHGSVYWMAPEVLSGPAGRRSDIWSVGCTVLEMCSAQHPWPNLAGKSLPDALKVIGQSDQLPPFPENMSKEALHFVKLCLRRDVTKRPYTKDLLMKVLWLQTPVATPPTTTTTTPSTSNTLKDVREQHVHNREQMNFGGSGNARNSPGTPSLGTPSTVNPGSAGSTGFSRGDNQSAGSVGGYGFRDAPRTSASSSGGILGALKARPNFLRDARHRQDAQTPPVTPSD